MKSTDYQPVVIPRSYRRIMTYQERDYHIFVSIPADPPPESGFPVIYLLDGNSVFATVTEAIRIQSRGPERTGVYPAMVVGIGYPTDDPYHPTRFYDYTYEVPAAELPGSPKGAEWPQMGGAEQFLTFLEEELKPSIENDFPIDRTQQAILGHSLGGLFVLHVLLSRPNAFQRYIAGSPSIHWNESVLLAKESQLPSLLTDDLDVHALLTIGELENDGRFLVKEKSLAMIERLSSMGKGQIKASFKEFANENHSSVLPVFISQGLRFATKKTARY
ncbi:MULTISPECIES: alpha/beta hydrolase [unclassified Brevibacillus]|uniref:alpha/beta hydrolase n=1 Tax=unclassified Brevibacillus TaxID=2684853 RepID=UPI003566EF89